MIRHITRQGEIISSCARFFSRCTMLLPLVCIFLGSCGNSPPSLPADGSSQGSRLHFLKSWQGAGYFLLENTSSRHIKLRGIKADDGTVYVEYGADYQCQARNYGTKWYGMLEIRDYLSQSEFDVAPGREQQIAYGFPIRPPHHSPRDPSVVSSDDFLRHDRCKLVLRIQGGNEITSPIFSMEGEDVVVWKVELPSPDKKYVATSEVVQLGDFDTEDIEANVYIKRADDKGGPLEDEKEIGKALTLRSPGPVPHPYELDEANHGGPMQVALKWLTSSQLEISYQGHPQVHQILVGIDQVQIRVRASNSADAK
jgi:hypothetical protein